MYFLSLLAQLNASLLNKNIELYFIIKVFRTFLEQRNFNAYPNRLAQWLISKYHGMLVLQFFLRDITIVHSEKKYKSCHCGGTLSKHEPFRY